MPVRVAAPRLRRPAGANKAASPARTNDDAQSIATQFSDTQVTILNRAYSTHQTRFPENSHGGELNRDTRLSRDT